ncbi:MAG: hypothetical protein ACREDX_02775 [Aestuariivirga sp.]
MDRTGEGMFFWAHEEAPPVTTKSRINPWIVVWLCFTTLAIVMSARQSVSIMTDEWVRTLGWSKTFIGSG